MEEVRYERTVTMQELMDKILNKLSEPKHQTFPKPKRIKDQAHLDKVRNLPCVVCSAPPPSDPHHPRGAKWGTGTGLKAGDDKVIPLCRMCHDEYHRLGRDTWEARYNTHEVYLEQTRGKMSGA